jgi:hypothetical protein
MSATVWSQLEAEQAFTRAARARRRAWLVCRVRRGGQCGGLVVYDDTASRRSGRRAGRGVREISLDAIAGTLEPNRAADFDTGFRPSGRTRARWQRVWMAEHRGKVLPPISVVQVGDAYAVRDGHHRVSVAKAGGALTINATVDAG